MLFNTRGISTAIKITEFSKLLYVAKPLQHWVCWRILSRIHWRKMYLLLDYFAQSATSIRNIVYSIVSARGADGLARLRAIVFLPPCGRFAC